MFFAAVHESGPDVVDGARCAQHDLTLMMRNPFEIFYARDGRLSFHMTTTLSRHAPDRNPAAQPAPDLMLANPLCCLSG